MKEKIEARTCIIPVPKEECELKKCKCTECDHKPGCDYGWIIELWENENKVMGKDSLLGPADPRMIKPDMRKGHFITITGKYDFCRFNVSRKKDLIIIYDIYVDEKGRGQGLSRKLLQYLMDKYDRDIFAKCVRGTSAEDFWRHIGKQLDANLGKPEPHDMYEHRDGKRDLGWYLVENKNKKTTKEELW
ncbi:MAG: GNAT family N-acetyltransferase [Bacilli bacterium]|nr:GNAT family N-acetyltransferase [Bacilli bacterium]